MLSPYWQSFQALRGVHLESSPIRAVELSRRFLQIDLDLVLTPSHPGYRTPAGGQDHDSRPARLLLRGERIQLVVREGPATEGVAEDHPLGKISSWTVDEAGWSLLDSDLWSARLLCHTVHLTLHP